MVHSGKQTHKPSEMAVGHVLNCHSQQDVESVTEIYFHIILIHTVFSEGKYFQVLNENYIVFLYTV